jgi:hypothetical protein
MESGRARPFAFRHRAPKVRCEWAASRFAYSVISTSPEPERKRLLAYLATGAGILMVRSGCDGRGVPATKTDSGGGTNDGES